MSNTETKAVQTQTKPALQRTQFEKAVMAANLTFKKIYGPEAESKFLKEFGFAVMQAKNNKMLASCDPESVKHSIIQVALTGLTLNPVRQSAYLVPRGKTCTLDIGYQGMIDILVTSGSVKSIYGGVVLKGDHFEYEQSTEIPKLIHRPNLETEMVESNCLAAYCIVTYPDGEKQPFVMRKGEVLAHKNASKIFFRKKN